MRRAAADSGRPLGRKGASAGPAYSASSLWVPRSRRSQVRGYTGNAEWSQARFCFQFCLAKVHRVAGQLAKDNIRIGVGDEQSQATFCGLNLGSAARH